MENPLDSDTIIRETTEAVKREIDFYRELKRRRNALTLSIWRPKAELTPQQVQAYQQSRCDPELREVARAVLEEVQYNRNERSMGYRVLIIAFVVSVGFMILIPLVIYFSVRGSGKHKLKY